MSSYSELGDKNVRICENVYEIGRLAASLEFDGVIEAEDSRSLFWFCLDLAAEFEKTYADGGDYLSEIDAFAMPKLKEGFLKNLDTTEGLSVTAVSEGEASKIIESRKPIGTFLVEREDGGCVGIDNRTGDAWTEDFPDKKKCLKWLSGETEKEDE